MAAIDEDMVEEFLEFGRFKPIMSMTKDTLIEMQKFFLMKIIAGYPDGITAYQIHSSYNFPRSNVIRYLGDLEEEGLLSTNEEILDGRANKFFLLTPAGFNFLAELKEKWMSRFAMMEDLTSNYFTEAEKCYYVEKFSSLEGREEKVAYMQKMRRNIGTKLERLSKRQELLTQLQRQVDGVISALDSGDVDEAEVTKLFDIIRKEDN